MEKLCNTLNTSGATDYTKTEEVFLPPQFDPHW